VTRASGDIEAVAFQLVSESALTPQLSSFTSPNCSELLVSQYYLGKGSVFPEVFCLLSQLSLNGSAALAPRPSLPHLLEYIQEGFGLFPLAPGTTGGEV